MRRSRRRCKLQHMLCLAFAIQLGTGAEDADALRAAPMAHWAFDTLTGGNAIPDRSGNGHRAEIVRSRSLTGPLRPSLDPGIRGKAMRCGGSRQYGYFCSVPNAPRPAGPFTVTLWVKPAGGQWITRILYYKPGWLRREGFELQLSSTSVAIVLCPQGATKETRHWVRTKLPVGIQHWSFLSVCWDGEAWQLFLNGRLMAEERSEENAFVAPAADVPLVLGGYSVHTNNTFVGLLDEVRVWPRALSAAELEQVMLDDTR